MFCYDIGTYFYVENLKLISITQEEHWRNANVYQQAFPVGGAIFRLAVFW